MSGSDSSDAWERVDSEFHEPLGLQNGANRPRRRSRELRCRARLDYAYLIPASVAALLASSNHVSVP